MQLGNINETPEGYLELVLTSELVSYEGFRKWAKDFVADYGAERMELIDGPDCRVQRVRILGENLELVFRDFPVETTLIAKTLAAKIVLRAIAELEFVKTRRINGNS